jgi:hypothetical protein
VYALSSDEKTVLEWNPSSNTWTNLGINPNGIKLESIAVFENSECRGPEVWALSNGNVYKSTSYENFISHICFPYQILAAVTAPTGCSAAVTSLTTNFVLTGGGTGCSSDVYYWNKSSGGWTSQGVGDCYRPGDFVSSTIGWAPGQDLFCASPGCGGFGCYAEIYYAAPSCPSGGC